MRLSSFLALLLLAAPTLTRAQWQLQDAHTTAGLRGIDNLGHGVAWASGTNGTVLRTEDAGFVWQLCAIPPLAEHLDFRAIQAFDNNTAIVMSSGKGDLSRLYKTTDGCQTWTLLFTNPDKDGFWDAFMARAEDRSYDHSCRSSTRPIIGAVFGDQAVHSPAPPDSTTQTSFFATSFSVNSSCMPDKLDRILSASSPEIRRDPIGSTSVLVELDPGTLWSGSAREFVQYELGVRSPTGDVGTVCESATSDHKTTSPRSASNSAILKRSAEHADVEDFTFSHCLRDNLAPIHCVEDRSSKKSPALVACSGDPRLATTPPHGFRSAVAYDPTHHLWITVGPNGTDISTDDGRNWQPLQPNPAAGDTPDAHQHFNALSLPYAVGPHGRIATLRPDALSQLRQPQEQQQHKPNDGVH